MTPDTRETRKAGRRIDLSTRESLLLECLLRAEGNVVSRRDIIRAVWEYDFDPGTNLVDVYVKRLREKVGRGSAFPLILTIRGLGYALRSQSKPCPFAGASLLIIPAPSLWRWR